MSEALVLRVFTHPACAGCPAAVKVAWELTEAHPEVELRTVKLESKEGLDEAHRHKVKTIPTLILFRGDTEVERWVGTPTPQAIIAALEVQ